MEYGAVMTGSDAHEAWAAAGALLDDIDVGPEGQASERVAEDRGDR